MCTLEDMLHAHVRHEHTAPNINTCLWCFEKVDSHQAVAKLVMRSVVNTSP